MDRSTEQFILDIMDAAPDLTLATVRPDGYPQATTVSYAHDGLDIYVGIGKHSQKADNLHACDKVSVTISPGYTDWNHIKGVSLGGKASFVSDPKEAAHAADCMMKRFPQVSDWAGTMSEEMEFIRIRPEVISVLDYEKGFGHTELVRP
ncbi:pyridoxamine 5'-phosphate oxidase family protein [Lacisediminimonas profundi]|uniref:pyridoxamine 5'-phosphate oxidase family protein n=1 Tax=Lacisediminimonas profundi TaxID=2603856 RepID=UPI00124AF00E|nr:pyridoxamine 5'-phosphate oxidase family protein [Lacisediminimonas profundi]